MVIAAAIIICVVLAVSFGAAWLMTYDLTMEDVYGRHWQSGTALHGGSNYFAGNSAGGASTLGPVSAGEDSAGGGSGSGTIQWHGPMTHHGLQPPAYLGAGAQNLQCTQAMAQLFGAQAAQMAAMQANQAAMQPSNWMSPLVCNNAFVQWSPLATMGAPHPKTALKSEGIRAGEIIAWRAYRVDGDTLRSATADAIWSGAEPMKGDAAGGYGIHAYKSPHGPMMDGYADTHQNGMWVIGEVALWGDVIEHERGYRAEFGRVHSLVTWSKAVPGLARAAIEQKYLRKPE